MFVPEFNTHYLIISAMGMYTELIFGAKLKKETPTSVIDALKYMVGETKERPTDFPFPEGRVDYLFGCSSYSFGVNKGLSKMWFDDISGCFHISTRSNIKNYENEIESFLEWIKPYIESGSGERDIYAMVIYEESSSPNIYYLCDEDGYRD